MEMPWHLHEIRGQEYRRVEGLFLSRWIVMLQRIGLYDMIASTNTR